MRCRSSLAFPATAYQPRLLPPASSILFQRTWHVATACAADAACHQNLALHCCHQLSQCLGSVFSRHDHKSVSRPQRSSTRRFEPAPLPRKDVSIEITSVVSGLHVHVQLSVSLLVCCQITQDTMSQSATLPLWQQNWKSHNPVYAGPALPLYMVVVTKSDAPRTAQFRELQVSQQRTGLPLTPACHVFENVCRLSGRVFRCSPGKCG